MTANSLYDLPAPITLTPSQLGTVGRFRIVNRGPGPTVALTVHLTTDRGAADIEITRPGDSLSFDLGGVRFIEIEANVYPASILFLSSDLPIALDAAPIIGNTAQDPVFVTGDLGWTKAAEYPDGFFGYGLGQGALIHKVVTARDGLSPLVIVPTGGALSLGESYCSLMELPASGGVPLRLAAATSFGGDAGGPYSIPIPDLANPGGALVDVIGFTDDPDFGPPVDVTLPAGYTSRIYVPRQGAGRISQGLQDRATWGGLGLAYTGNVIGGLDMRVVRALFANVGAVPVQTAFGYVVSGSSHLIVTLGAIPTPGNLLVGLLETNPGHPADALGIMAAGALAGT